MPPKRKSDSAEPSLKRKVLGVVNEIDGKFVCDAQPECKYTQASLNPHNFARHIGVLHPEVFNLLELGDPIPEEEIAKRKSKLSASVEFPNGGDNAMVKVSKTRVLGGVVKLVTKHHQAFNILNWEGLRDIIDHQLEPFGVELNNKNIAEYVGRVRSEVDKIICKEVKNQMMSIMFDTTTKRFKSVLGVNAQFFKGTKLVKRTLGMVKLNEGHTAKCLKNRIEELYRKFEIEPWQIYTGTVDNARNVCATISDLQESQREEREEPIEEYAKYLEHEEMSDDEIISNIEMYNELLSDHEMICVRCGAHTLNLVVADNTSGSANEETSTIISNIVQVVKSYRKIDYRETFKLSQQKFPPIPNTTRWNVNYVMMQTLASGRPFFDRLAVNALELDLSQYWDFISEYCDAFKALYEATVRIQKLFCPLSQFYLEWLSIHGHVAALPDNNRFKEGIQQSMKRREKVIFRNDAYRSAIYMDPRFVYNGSKMFTPSERDAIIAYLETIWKKVNSSKLRSEFKQESESERTESKASSSHAFNMDQYISLMFGEESASPEDATDSIEQALKDVQYQKRQSADDFSFNVIEYWFKQRIRDTRMWEIARVVYTAASTQVSVERDDSHFGLIFTPQRDLIGEENLENILQVRSNEELITQAIGFSFAPNVTS